MKNRFFLHVAAVLGVFLLISHVVLAGTPTVNARQENKKKAMMDAQAEEIEIMTSRPDRPYKMLAIVKADDVFTSKPFAAYHSLRLQALKLHADAITEVECHNVAKHLAITCMGYAVQWK